MEVHAGFYGRPKHIPQSSKSDTEIKLDRLINAVQANADSIKGVCSKWNDVAGYRSIENKKCAITSNTWSCYGRFFKKWIPSVLSVRFQIYFIKCCSAIVFVRLPFRRQLSLSMQASLINSSSNLMKDTMYLQLYPMLII